MGFFGPPGITDRQKEYIAILSDYESTKAQDEEDIQNFLKKANKTEVAQLSKTEASQLIQILLKRPAEYVFPCGKKATLSKQEINGFNVLGKLEGCLHACPDGPDGTDVNDCTYWQNYEAEKAEEEEMSDSSH
jgi:hypothetical protein